MDRYRTTGTLVQQMGWKVLDIGAEGRRRETKGSAEEKLPSRSFRWTLAKGQLQDVIDIEARKKKTRPPKRFTEGTLLTAMQTAGQSLDERELSEAMKETGLGTPATRAAIIEVLLKRGFIVRTGKNLEATEKGIHLIEVVHPEVKSPAMTGQWEAFLKKIQHGQSRLEPFLDGISQYVRSVVGKVGQTAPVQRATRSLTHPKVSDSPDLTSAKNILKLHNAHRAVAERVRLLHVPAQPGSRLQARSRRAKTRCSSCRQGRASRFVTSCRDWHEVEPRS